MAEATALVRDGVSHVCGIRLTLTSVHATPPSPYQPHYKATADSAVSVEKKTPVKLCRQLPEARRSGHVGTLPVRHVRWDQA
ncbi:hypothetical protein RRG08_025948 [Elysia crispata]|uniref:Uncharacterized protein n=1 Tax=Elysia crispata TaxID=231223 RepID=A0AAE1DFG0_9GAST|nr:hypothetical protein RRG08_025948 [Elysia crispata]